jgi:BASS family bile acid:Na+ symporter
MDSALVTAALPAALAAVMFGLGLDLTVADFRRVGTHPKAVAVALGCQLVVLPLVCFGLVVLFHLPDLLGIGLLLLAAAPGGSTANLFSHLLRGDVALNITLTALNSAISLVTLPLVSGLAIAWYDREDHVSVPPLEVLAVAALVVLPVALGMLVHRRNLDFALRMQRSVRIGSVLLLALVVVAILLDARERVADDFVTVGVAAALFCALSLVLGYAVPKLFGLSERQSIASSMEIGVHNSALAIVVAVGVLDEAQISVPAAVYSLVMFPFAALWGWAVTRRR